MPRPNIDVVIPTFGGWTLTESCLRHLAAQTVPHRVIVVDNGSPDGTPGRIRDAFPDVEVHQLGENRGFGAACNVGTDAGSGEVVVLLNNDVDADPDFLERLAEALARDPRIGTVAPLLLRPGRRLIDSVGLAADPTLAGFARLQGHPMSAAGDARPVLLGPSGGAAAYRRQAWEQVGGMDERIFLYQEDLDLGLRLRAAGWLATTAPDATAVHLGSATAGRRSASQRRHAGFARGYLLRRYGVLRSPVGPRALLIEALVAAGDIAVSRDTAALQGRLAGWRAAAGLAARTRPVDALDRRIDLRESIRLRRTDYAVAGARNAPKRVP